MATTAILGLWEVEYSDGESPPSSPPTFIIGCSSVIPSLTVNSSLPWPTRICSSSLDKVAASLWSYPPSPSYPRSLFVSATGVLLPPSHLILTKAGISIEFSPLQIHVTNHRQFFPSFIYLCPLVVSIVSKMFLLSELSASNLELYQLLSELYSNNNNMTGIIIWME